MKTKFGLSIFLCFFWALGVSMAQTSTPTASPDIKSYVDSTAAGELILRHEVWIDAPLEKVWDAFTTAEGWAGWVTPVVEIDFRVGGIIVTNYNPEGTLHDDTANRLFVRNYVPYRLLTLQADIAKNWPEFMKAEADELYNVIQFESVDKKRTRLISYGLGYKNNDKYKALMDFFIQGNELSYVNLKKYLEK